MDKRGNTKQDTMAERPVCPYCNRAQDSKYSLKRHKVFCAVSHINRKG